MIIKFRPTSNRIPEYHHFDIIGIVFDRIVGSSDLEVFVNHCHLMLQVGEEDELEEDVEQCLSCRESVIEVER